MSGRTWKKPLKQILSVTILCMGVAALGTADVQDAFAKTGEKSGRPRQKGDPLAKLPGDNKCPADVKARHSQYVDTINGICNPQKASLAKKLDDNYKKGFNGCVFANTSLYGVVGTDAKLSTAGQYYEKAAKLVGKSIYDQNNQKTTKFQDEQASADIGSVSAAISDMCKRLKVAASEVGNTCLGYREPKAGETLDEVESAQCSKLLGDGNGQAGKLKDASLISCRFSAQANALAAGMNRARWMLRQPDEKPPEDLGLKGPPSIKDVTDKAQAHQRNISDHLSAVLQDMRVQRQANGKRMPEVEKFDKKYFPSCEGLYRFLATDLRNDYTNKLMDPVKDFDTVIWKAERDAAKDADAFGLQSSLVNSRSQYEGSNWYKANELPMVKNPNDAKELARALGGKGTLITGNPQAQFATQNGKNCYAVQMSAREVKWVCTQASAQ